MKWHPTFREKLGETYTEILIPSSKAGFGYHVKCYRRFVNKSQVNVRGLDLGKTIQNSLEKIHACVMGCNFFLVTIMKRANQSYLSH